MRSRFYIEGEGRAEGVRDLFACVARRYDLINDLQSFGLHRYWKRQLVRRAAPAPQEKALDLCCGTGDIALALARAGARVIGADFSEPMLAVARERTGHRRATGDGPPPEFVVADALGLPFSNRQFDLVTIAYGLRNLRSVEAGLEEMARVTRRGGRVLVLDFATPENATWRALYLWHLRHVVPRLGRVVGGDAETHAYILDSLERYPRPAEIARRMEQNGWAEVRWWNLLGGVMTIHRGVRAA